MIQVAVMATAGRPRIQTAMLERLLKAGGLFDAPLVRCPRIYFACLPWAGALPPLPPAYNVFLLEAGKPYVPAFWRVLEDADPTADLLFLEDDVWSVKNFVPLVAELEVPAWAGAVSLFDFRNEAPRGQGFSKMPSDRPFWGSQAVLFPARVLPALVAIARARVDYNDPNSWDQWIGRAVDSLGLFVALYAPSLVQHLGHARSIASPGDSYRPTAVNFPEPWPDLQDPRPPCAWCHGKPPPYTKCGQCGARGAGKR